MRDLEEVKIAIHEKDRLMHLDKRQRNATTPKTDLCVTHAYC